MFDLNGNEPLSAHKNAISGAQDFSENKVFTEFEDRFASSQALDDIVQIQVRKVVPFLFPGEEYTTEMLCGVKFWKLLSDGERRMAGRSLSDMVLHGRLPMKFARYTSGNSRLYRLK